MDWSDWLNPVAIATLILAIITSVLALAAFLAIRQTRNIQENEKREKLLNEIIEWAEDVGAYILNRNIPPFEEHFIKSGTYFGEYLDESIQEAVIAEYTKFRVRSVYIANITKVVPGIQNLVESAIKYLRGIIRLLNKYNENYNAICDKDGEQKAARNIARTEDCLYGSMVKITETIGDIKSLD